MLSIDTNIFLYSMMEEAPLHKEACFFLKNLGDSRDVIIADLVLVELYSGLRNPALFKTPATANEAANICLAFRNHPHWQLVENASIMSSVWEGASHPHFARRHIFDLRLAKTLQAHGVQEFATANVKDFQDLGFRKVWNPLSS